MATKQSLKVCKGQTSKDGFVIYENKIKMLFVGKRIT